MGISNALCALAGALFAQSQGGADISMGIGTIVIGLAAVIVGESIMPSRKLVVITLAVIVGAVLYRFFIALALNADFIGLKAQDLKLVTAVLVPIALVITLLKQSLRGQQGENGRAHVGTPDPNEHHVCRVLLYKDKESIKNNDR